MKKFKMGFTLAEVLITLSIIGIVAAIVMPSVMSSYQYKTVGVKLSKFASMIEQSARAYVVMNDTLTYNSNENGTTDTITPFLQESLILNPNTREQQIAFVGVKNSEFTCTSATIKKSTKTHTGCIGHSVGDKIWEATGTPTRQSAEQITNIKRASTEGADDNIITLKDNTQLTYYWVNPDDTDSYYDQDAERVGRVSFVISFKPNVKGLPTGVQDTYNFAVSELGYVFPSKTDACLTAIASNDWVSTGAVFKAGKGSTNGGVCNTATNN